MNFLSIRPLSRSLPKVRTPVCFRPKGRTIAFKRSGAAIIELAVCLPLLVLITLATIEAYPMIFLKQTLTIAAFEHARIGILPGSAAQNVEAQSQLVLTDHSLANFSISMTPDDPAALSEGGRVQMSRRHIPRIHSSAAGSMRVKRSRNRLSWRITKLSQHFADRVAAEIG